MCESELSIALQTGPGKAWQVVAGGRRRRRAVLEDQMRDEHRPDQRNRRPGVEFVVEALAERVLLRGRRSSDGGLC